MPVCVALTVGLQPYLWGYSPMCPTAACQLHKKQPKNPMGAATAQQWTPHHPWEVAGGPTHPLLPPKVKSEHLYSGSGRSRVLTPPLRVKQSCLVPPCPITTVTPELLLLLTPFCLEGTRVPGTAPQPDP